MFVTLLWTIVLLGCPSGSDTPKRWLGLFMLSTFLLFLTHAVYYQQLRELYIYFDPLFSLTALLAYPLYFLYIKSLTTENLKWKDSIAILLPAVLVFSASVVVYILMDPSQREYYVQEYLFAQKGIGDAEGLLRVQKFLGYMVQFIYPLQIIYALVMIRKLVNQYNWRIESFYSDIEGRNISWANWILHSFVAISLVSLVCNILGRAFFTDSLLLLLIPSAAFSLLLFVFGYLGNLQQYSIQNFISDSSGDASVAVVDLLDAEYNFLSVSNSMNSDENTDINASATQLRDELVALFESSNIFTKSDLKITDVASLLNTNRTYISQVINKNFSCSFNVFVNRYRLKKAAQMLSDPRCDYLTIESIALESGFGSMHSFIRVFKDEYKLTPGKFRMVK